MTQYKDGQQVWGINKKVRVVFYASFGFNLQTWSKSNDKWYSHAVSKDLESFDALAPRWYLDAKKRIASGSSAFSTPEQRKKARGR